MTESIIYLDFHSQECSARDAVYVIVENIDEDGNQISSKLGIDDKRYHEELRKAMAKKDKTEIKRRK